MYLFMALIKPFGTILRTTEWIDCASPVVLVTGSMNVAVTNNGEEYSSENMMLEYVEGATVTSLVPSTGPITGGTHSPRCMIVPLAKVYVP